MDRTRKLTSELRPPDRGTDPNNKFDIKGICEKFENLSNASESGANFNETYTPVPPFRRKRSNLNDSSNKNSDKTPNDSKILSSAFNNLSSTKSLNATPASAKNVSSTKSLNETPTSVKRSSVGNLISTKSLKVRPTSVKEKTKLFESPLTTKQHFNSSNSKLIDSDKVLPVIENFSVLGHGCIKKTEKINALNVSTPPAKPRRNFQHLELTTENNLYSETLKNNPVSGIKEKQISKLELKSRNSFSCESKPGESVSKTSRPDNSSEIPVSNDKSLQSTPKQVKSSGKAQIILSCLKNISSTANNICEKVKQKHSNIFVDLTPTTVSPPKHYGTLKRSLSEEHIYAEPADVCKLDSNEPKYHESEPLHYMCTSLIPPAVPHRTKTEDNKSTSNFSVKNMIYGSFAGLRTTKENTESASNAAVTDSSEADLSQKAIEARIIYVKSVRKQVSSSSLCLAPKLYEALFIINVVEDQPQVTHSFPMKVNDDYKIPLLPHICFPYSNLWKSVSVYQSEVFHFSLIEKNENIFGYCLRIQGWPDASLNNEPLCVKFPLAICILSSFNAPVFYRKLLLEIEKHLTLPRNNCFKYIRSLQKLGVPNAGASLSIPDCSENSEADRIIISRPLDSHFVGLEMTRTLQLLDVDILVKCVASLFLERRILFFSASTSNLYHCCKAISSLLYPFEWPHLIVPVLPACLTIHCCSEQPYILGIVNNDCDRVLDLLAEHELLIIDIDKGTIIKSCNDEDTILPRKVQKAVMSALNLAKKYDRSYRNVERYHDL